MITTEVNRGLIGRRCECIFTGLMVAGVIGDIQLELRYVLYFCRSVNILCNIVIKIPMVFYLFIISVIIKMLHYEYWRFNN